MNYLMIAKLCCLFLGVLFTIVNFVRMYYKNTISTMNFLYQAVGIVGFIVIQFQLYK